MGDNGHKTPTPCATDKRMYQILWLLLEMTHTNPAHLTGNAPDTVLPAMPSEGVCTRFSGFAQPKKPEAMHNQGLLPDAIHGLAGS